MKARMTPHEPHANGTFLREIVFGVEDGLISTLGIVTGVSGAAVGSNIIILAGLAGIFSGAISMAAGTYLSTKSERQLYVKELAREYREVEEMPDQEKKEIREIFAAKGYKGKELEKVVKLISANKDIWVTVMMQEELKMSPQENEHPKKAGAAIALSFIPGGFVPLLPYLLLPAAAALPYSLVLTALGLLIFGGYKARFTKANALLSGIEMLSVGMLAAAAGYAIGLAFGVGALGI